MKTHDYKPRKNLAGLLICLILTLGMAIPIFAAAPVKTTASSTIIKTPTVTATLQANPASYSGVCPTTIKFDGKITVAGITKANAPFTVTYEFTRSDGAKDTRPKTLTFKQDGSQSVSTTWMLGGDKVPSYKGWIAIKIGGKPPVESNKAEFSIQCKTGPLNAGRQEVPKPAQKVKAEDLKFTQNASRKIPSTYSPEDKRKAQAAISKGTPVSTITLVDLVPSSIKAYYNEARTKPVGVWYGNSGRYHLSQVANDPQPHYVFFTVRFTNIGFISAATDVTNKVLLKSNPSFFAPIFYETSPPVTLEPGESVEYDYQFGPLDDYSIVNKSIIIAAAADTKMHVSEDVENNNVAQYTVQFISP